MNTEDAIAKLAEDLDEWFEEGHSTLAVPDRFAQDRAIDRGVAIVRKLEQLKTSALKALKSLIAKCASAPDSERMASLIKAFAVGAKLKSALHDELLDTDGEKKIAFLMNDIAAALDTTSQGKSALAELLDHADVRVRASAGAYLLTNNLIPDRVVPLLRTIEERSEGRSADFTAHWALLDWELKQKAAAIKSNK
jgi:hypothetical protein